MRAGAFDDRDAEFFLPGLDRAFDPVGGNSMMTARQCHVLAHIDVLDPGLILEDPSDAASRRELFLDIHLLP